MNEYRERHDRQGHAGGRETYSTCRTKQVSGEIGVKYRSTELMGKEWGRSITECQLAGTGMCGSWEEVLLKTNKQNTQKKAKKKQKPMSKSLAPIFSSSFMVLGLMFKSLTHFYLIHMYGVK